MGAQTLYRSLRDHRDVNNLHVENATSGRRRGADTRGGGFNSISEPRLDYAADDSPASAIMADRPWEPKNTSPMQQQSSPMLQSSSSQSSHEQQPRTQDVSTTSSMQPPGSTRSSLIETLQTCLQSNSPSPPTSRSQLGTQAKPLKRRSRVSRRVPTVTLEATSSEFLGIVQRLTGVSAAQPSAGAAPVRPQPHRVAPVTTFIRPDRPTPSILNFSGIDTQQNFSRSHLFAPRGYDGGSSSSTTTFATPSPIVATAPTSLPSWTWDSGPSNPFPEIASTSQPENSITLPDGSEFSLSQFDAWLSGQDDT